MTSRLLLVICLAAGATLFTSCTSSKNDGVKRDRLGANISPDKEIMVEGYIERICEDALGYDYPNDHIGYKQLPASRIWFITTKGHHGPITSQFEIQNGSIARSAIRFSKEQRGKRIRSGSFLRQFNGLSLSSQNRPTKQVDGITGATNSSKAVEVAALLALRLDAFLVAK